MGKCVGSLWDKREHWEQESLPAYGMGITHSAKSFIDAPFGLAPTVLLISLHFILPWLLQGMSVTRFWDGSTFISMKL